MGGLREEIQEDTNWRGQDGKFLILVDNKVIASGLTLKDVSKKVEEFLNG